MEARSIALFLAGSLFFGGQALKAQDLDELFTSITGTTTTTCPPCTRLHLDSSPETAETTPGDLGTIDADGNYHPKDKSVQRLHDAGDFKSFIDYSLDGRGVKIGFAYELVDISYHLPKSARRKLDEQDRIFEARCKEMTPALCAKTRQQYVIDRAKVAHKMRTALRWPLTVDLGVDGDKIGFHFGTKVIGIIDGGIFYGVKWNFKVEEWERTIGLQVLKFSF